MTFYNENDKRKIIMDYYQHPRNRVVSFTDDTYDKIYLHSSSCVDEITLYFNKDRTDFNFVAQGCAIFLSSCEIFIEIIQEIGFDRKDELIKHYQDLVNRQPMEEKEQMILGKLNIFENVARHLNRKECALLICSVFTLIK